MSRFYILQDIYKQKQNVRLFLDWGATITHIHGLASTVTKHRSWDLCVNRVFSKRIRLLIMQITSNDLRVPSSTELNLYFWP